MASVAIDLKARGDAVIVPGQLGVQIGVQAYVLSGNGTVRFFSGPSATGTLLGGARLRLLTSFDDIAEVPACIVAPALIPHANSWTVPVWFYTNPGDPLIVNLDDGDQCLGHVNYTLKSADTPPI